jgi:hypothetical protein
MPLDTRWAHCFTPSLLLPQSGRYPSQRDRKFHIQHPSSMEGRQRKRRLQSEEKPTGDEEEGQ